MQDLNFTKKEADKGYLNHKLLVPKSIVNQAAIKSALTFFIGEEEIEDERYGNKIVPKKVELWDETTSHLVLPRAFFDKQTRDDFSEIHGVEWVQESHRSKKISLPDNIIPRDDTQKDALAAMRKHRGGTVHLACGGGKTIIALKYWVTLGRPALVVVNSSALADQWRRKIWMFLKKDLKIGLIGGGKSEWKNCPIVIATVQSLANKRDEWPMEFRRYFGVVFFDEGHHMAAPHFVKAADLFFGQRFSLTATAFRTDGLEALSMYHIGDIIYQNLGQELIPDTLFHRLLWEATSEENIAARDRSGKIHHRRLCIMLGTVDWRNRLIIEKLAEDLKENREVLLLTHSVEHTRALGALAKRLWEKTGVINGQDVAAFDRIPTLEVSNPVIGTFDLAREALDKSVLDTLHICTPFGNANDLQQSWGRIQRRGSEKKPPRVRVYEDLVSAPSSSPGKKQKQLGTPTHQCRLLRKYLRALRYPYKNQKEETPWTSAK